MGVRRTHGPDAILVQLALLGDEVERAVPALGHLRKRGVARRARAAKVVATPLAALPALLEDYQYIHLAGLLVQAVHVQEEWQRVLVLQQAQAGLDGEAAPRAHRAGPRNRRVS